MNKARKTVAWVGLAFFSIQPLAALILPFVGQVPQSEGEPSWFVAGGVALFGLLALGLSWLLYRNIFLQGKGGIVTLLICYFLNSFLSLSGLPVAMFSHFPPLAALFALIGLIQNFLMRPKGTVSHPTTTLTS